MKKINLRLLRDPSAMIQRLALALHRNKRRRRLRETPAYELSLGHIDSLELLLLLGDNPPKVIHDIGANQGTWTCLAKSLYPEARVEAFEPLDQFDTSFTKWTSFWPGTIHQHRLALGNETMESKIHILSSADASSLLSPTQEGQSEFHLVQTNEMRVPVRRLDDLVADGLVAAPDLIKLDVQGYELEVLKGASNTLQSTRAVLCELSTHSFYENQPLFGEVVAFLERAGFRLHAFNDNMVPGQPFSQTDALFLRP